MIVTIVSILESIEYHKSLMFSLYLPIGDGMCLYIHIYDYIYIFFLYMLYQYFALSGSKVPMLKDQTSIRKRPFERVQLQLSMEMETVQVSSNRTCLNP